MAPLVLLVLVGCDPALRREGGAAEAPAPAGSPRLGREGESCARVADCLEPLRCVAAVCVPGATSTLAELHWAAASVAGETGESRADLYQKASAQYEADDLPVPAALLCEHGRFLLAQPEAQSGEQAARLLHRCVLGAAPGSALRREGLRDLARLAPRGLDPALLARTAPADTYLVNPPTPPPAERLDVEVARTTPAGDRGYGAFADLLGGARARPALLACHKENWLRTHQAQMSTTLPLKLRARLDDDEEYAGGTLEINAAPDDAAAACLRAGLAPLAAEFAKGGSSGSWQGTVTVTVRPSRQERP